MQVQTGLAIAAGGAIGALLRHFFNGAVTHALGTGFPYGILFTNILGSFLLGCLISLFAHVLEPSQALRAFLVVGLLGAFTTFSTFSLDAVLLIERGAYLASALYILFSVVVAIAALFAGMQLVRVVAV